MAARGGTDGLLGLHRATTSVWQAQLLRPRSDARAPRWPRAAEHVRHSHIGSAPLYVGSAVSLTTLPFSPMANPSRRQSGVMQKAKSISIEGPRGTVLVPLHEYVRLQWGDEPAGKTKAAATEKESASGGEDEPRKLTISVRNADDKWQRSTWGLTRALLANAIEGVQDGHVVSLRLVGVGYRAIVEADPFPRPDKFEKAFDEIKQSSGAASVSSSSRLGTFSSLAQRDYYAALYEGPASSSAPPQRQRLALRLGYSHPIFLPIPRSITCTTPQPTRIVLKGADKEALGLFASSIRKWRPPEPYKGKGVFVGDETIKLKAVRKK